MAAPVQYPVFNGYGWPIVRAPMWKTLVQEAASGKEYRLPLQTYPKWKWTLNYGYLFDDISQSWQTTTFMFQQLAGFFNLMQGQNQSFIYFDPYDNTVPSSTPQNFGTGDGTTALFPLLKHQTGGPGEPVQWVVANPTIYINGTPTGTAYMQSGSTSAVVVSPPAVVAFSPAPSSGAVLTWSGQFYYLCRFCANITRSTTNSTVYTP